jgi:hypothetical protein
MFLAPRVDILHDNLILGTALLLPLLWMALRRRPFNPSMCLSLSTSWVLLFSPAVGAFSGDVIVGGGAPGELDLTSGTWSGSFESVSVLGALTFVVPLLLTSFCPSSPPLPES